MQKIIRHFHEHDKPIFTICHGVQVLMAVPETIRGKEVAALQYCEPEVTAVGGIYIDVSPTGAHVDGKLVSAKGWTGLAAFMRECNKVLGTEIHHGEIKGAKPAKASRPQGGEARQRGEGRRYRPEAHARSRRVIQPRRTLRCRARMLAPLDRAASISACVTTEAGPSGGPEIDYRPPGLHGS